MFDEHTQRRRGMEMFEELAPFKVETVVKTYRLCYPKDDEAEFGLRPLKLGQKTLTVTSGFYRELVINSCRIKLAPRDALRYLWHFRMAQRLDVFSLN